MCDNGVQFDVSKCQLYSCKLVGAGILQHKWKQCSVMQKRATREHIAAAFLPLGCVAAPTNHHIHSTMMQFTISPTHPDTTTEIDMLKPQLCPLAMVDNITPVNAKVNCI